MRDLRDVYRIALVTLVMLEVPVILAVRLTRVFLVEQDERRRNG